jgi:UbiD family decarboxylase
MLFNDLREFIQRLDEVGQLKRVEGADWDLEIGTLTELMAERLGPALLFDKIKGYPEGYRVLSNTVLSKIEQRVAYNHSDEMSDVEIVRYWKDKWEQYKPVPPKVLKTGPVMENVITGDDINLWKFPVPKWHDRDGGRYIGTGVVTATRDLDEGWVNSGTYRVMVHDEKTVSFYSSPGKHANLMRRKYWDRGEECPVAMSFGEEPFLCGASTMPLPWGISELEFAGYMRGKPVDVIKGPVTGLPIPATAEIVVEGFSPPPSVDSRMEGPFGEWTGYYGSGRRTEPVVHIKAIYHRNDPIIYGRPPLKADDTFYSIPIHTVPFLWSQLEKAGVPGIKGVWVHGRGARVISVVSIKQMYLGHARQVNALAAALLSGGALAGKWSIVVDDDIDPSDWEDVLWALCTRCDPETSIEIVRGFLTSPLDPSLPPEKRETRDFTTAKVMINACRPYHWINDFAAVNIASPELRKKVLDKWGKLFK